MSTKIPNLFMISQVGDHQLGFYQACFELFCMFIIKHQKVLLNIIKLFFLDLTSGFADVPEMPGFPHIAGDVFKTLGVT